MRQMNGDRKSTRLNSSHTEIYTLSLHDALPISTLAFPAALARAGVRAGTLSRAERLFATVHHAPDERRSEEHTSELQSHRDLHSFPTRRSSDLYLSIPRCARAGRRTRRDPIARRAPFCDGPSCAR